MNIFSIFPKFWLDLEKNLGEYAEDLLQVKSVGYSTKASVARIKTTRKITCLEADYLKIRSANQDSFLTLYPELKSINAFTPGMKSMMFTITKYLNESEQSESAENSTEKVVQNIFERAKKVCK